MTTNTKVSAPVSYWTSRSSDQGNKPNPDVIRVNGISVMDAAFFRGPMIVVEYQLEDDDSYVCHAELNLFESLHYQIA